MYGKIIYCDYHDQGALICTDTTIQNLDHTRLSKNICMTEQCAGCWNNHGSFSIKDNKLTMNFDNKNQAYYDSLCGGWHIDYFKQEIYDNNYKPVTIIISDELIFNKKY